MTQDYFLLNTDVDKKTYRALIALDCDEISCQIIGSTETPREEREGRLFDLINWYGE